MSWPLLQNSLLLAGLTAGLALLAGVAAALFLAGLGGRWRMAGVGVTASVLAVPPFLAVGCWLDLLGRNGAWQPFLPVNLYALRSAAGVLASLLWPVSALMLLAAWQKLDPALFEAEPRMRGRRLLGRLLLPAARPALAQAAFLTFVLALGNFAVPAILQVKVFSAEVWLRFSTNLDHAGALLASLPLVVAPLLLLWWLRQHDVAWPRWQPVLPPAVLRRALGRTWMTACGTIAALASIAAVGVPVARLLTDARTWTQLAPAVAAGTPAIVTSFALAAGAATVVLAAGVILRSHRWTAGFWLWFLVPGVLPGIALIWLLNRPGLALLYQGPAVVVLALVLRHLALGWQGARLAAQGVDRDLSDAARLYGPGGWRWFRLVLWPQGGPTLLAAWYLVYLLCLWEVETLLVILPPGMETLALRVFNLLHYGHNPQVNALCLVLLVLAVLPLLAWVVAAAVRRRLATGGARPAGSMILAALAGLILVPGTGCSRSPEAGTQLESRLFSHVEIIGTRGRNPGQFNKPRSVTVDREDNLYVVDLTGRVQKFAPDGSWLLNWQMPETDLGKAKGLGFDGEGRVIVVEPHYSRVNHFTTQGTLVRQWGRRGTNAGELGLPRAVVANARGELWICEYTASERVQRFSPDGRRVLACFGRFGGAPGDFNRPEGLALDAQERLYVADSCNHRVQVFTADGTFLRAHGSAGTGPGEFSYPYDIRVDAAGHQFICEFGNSRIQVLDAADQPVEILGGPGAAPGRFSNPWSIALDSRGNLYVADAGNHRVQKLVRRHPPSRTVRRSKPAPGTGLAVDQGPAARVDRQSPIPNRQPPPADLPTHRPTDLLITDHRSLITDH